MGHHELKHKLAYMNSATVNPRDGRDKGAAARDRTAMLKTVGRMAETTVENCNCPADVASKAKA